MKKIYFWSLVAFLVVFCSSVLCYRIIQHNKWKRLFSLSYKMNDMEMEYFEGKTELYDKMAAEYKQKIAAENSADRIASINTIANLNNLEIQVAQLYIEKVNEYLGYQAAFYNEINGKISNSTNLREAVKNRHKDNTKLLYEQRITILKEQFDKILEIKKEFDSMEAYLENIEDPELKLRLQMGKKKVKAILILKPQIDTIAAQTMNIDELKYNLNAIESAFEYIIGQHI